MSGIPNKKVIAVIVLSAVVSWQLSSIVNGSPSGKSICVGQTAKVARRDECKADETELASNSVRRKQIRKRLMSSEPVVLRGGSGIRPAVSGTQSLTGAVGQSMRSYTYALTFERGWNGRIETSCGAFEVPITSTSAAYLNGRKLPETPPSEGGYYFNGHMIGPEGPDENGHFTYLTPRYELTGMSYPNVGVVTGAETWIAENVDDPSRFTVDPVWPTGLVLYVTQVCAPLTELAPG